MFTGIDALVDEVLVINIVGKYFESIAMGFTLPIRSIYRQHIPRKIIRAINEVPIIPARDTRSPLSVARTADKIAQNAANGITRNIILMIIIEIFARIPLALAIGRKRATSPFANILIFQ